MELTDRIVRIVYADGAGLIASDAYGRVHLLDDDLRLIRSSPFVRAGRPVYGLAVAEGWIIGKDRQGAVLRWSLDTLRLVDRLDPATTCDRSALGPDEEPSPITSRGIGIWAGRVHVSSGYHRQMLVIDLHTFEVLEVRPNICGPSPMEWACTGHPTRHAVSDKQGNLRFGSFDRLDFTDQVKLDSGTIHRVLYDPRHDRFWATQDYGDGANADVANGVVVVDPAGRKLDELLFARDDVEFLAFSPDHTRAYAGGFDGELHIFDNTEPRLRIVRTVKGFPHQLFDATVAPNGDVYLFCQDGEVIKVDPDGRLLRRLAFNRQAVWDIQPAPGDPGTLYCATDAGVAVLDVHDSVTGPMVSVRQEHVTGYGYTRRVVPLDTGWLGITRDRRVFRSDADGTERWHRILTALPHSIAVSPDGTRALVATNAGAVEFDTADGRPLARHSVDDVPIWAVVYLPSGERVLITHNGVIVVLDHAGRHRWRLDQGEYPKRVWIRDGLLYVTGDGGVKEIEVGQGVVGRWSRLLDNTVENAVIVDDLVIACSYGMQLATFDLLSTQLLGLAENLPDYPKALTVIRGADGRPVLLVGARSGLLSLYRIDRTAPGGPLVKLRDHWLAPRPSPLALTHHDHADDRRLTTAG